MPGIPFNTVRVVGFLLTNFCNFLQVVVYAAETQEIARSTPRDQRLFRRVAQLQYLILPALFISSLLQGLTNPLSRWRLFGGSSWYISFIRYLGWIAQIVSTSVTMLASMLLKIRSNPGRSQSKVCPIQSALRYLCYRDRLECEV